MSTWTERRNFAKTLDNLGRLYRDTGALDDARAVTEEA